MVVVRHPVSLRGHPEPPAAPWWLFQVGEVPLWRPEAVSPVGRGRRPRRKCPRRRCPLNGGADRSRTLSPEAVEEGAELGQRVQPGAVEALGASHPDGHEIGIQESFELLRGRRSRDAAFPRHFGRGPFGVPQKPEDVSSDRMSERPQGRLGVRHRETSRDGGTTRRPLGGGRQWRGRRATSSRDEAWTRRTLSCSKGRNSSVARCRNCRRTFWSHCSHTCDRGGSEG